MAASVFISYARANQDAVNRLVEEFREEGHETWLDLKLEGGRPWWDKILFEIGKSQIFVTTLTPESQACQRELRYAFDLRTPLLPIRLSSVVQMQSLSPIIRNLQVVDYLEQDTKTLRNLQRAIKSLPEAPPLPDPLPAPPPLPISYVVDLLNLIDAEKLDSDQQFNLVSKLRMHYHDGRPAHEIVDLVRRLKKRDDLIVKVDRELDQLIVEIDRGQSVHSLGAVQSAEPLPGGVATAADKTPTTVGEDPLSPVDWTDAMERQLELGSAGDECRSLMERVLKQGECWVFEIDATNSFFLTLDDSAAPPRILAKAELRDGVSGAKKETLKALGWKVSGGKWGKSAVAAGAVYLTSGLAAAALLSRGVRDYLMAFEGTHSWIVAGDKNVFGPAAEFALALQRVAPDVKRIIVRRRAANSQS
jgi:hypothetical protein